ncbi:DUF6624 domain-containing protein [Flaviaesturariibacter amylovorans]|uniref:Uncharacterized protein n=1 Tax=Flaviaesturariibacter amylovorans TaxID=1084520 RepID=A0ABP8HQJ1_9BACT
MTVCACALSLRATNPIATRFPRPIILLRLLLLAFLLPAAAAAQPDRYNYELAVRIDSLAAEDLKWRTRLQHLQQSGAADSSLRAFLQQQIRQTDAAHLPELRRMVAEHGFPGVRTVGAQTSDNFWLLLQHADGNPALQRQALQLMRQQVAAGNANAANFAFLQDRVLLNAGERQLFGTQVMLNADSTAFIPRPVADPSRLDARRAELGLPPMEEYLRSMQQRYTGQLRKRES